MIVFVVRRVVFTMDKTKTLKIVKICLLVILIVSVFMAFRRSQENQASVRDYNEALEIAGILGPKDFSNLTSTAQKEPDNTDPVIKDLNGIALDALKAINDEVIGWIEIPDTPISYPLLAGPDNNYYLKRNWKKDPNGDGAIFLEETNSSDLSDYHTIIYGHRIMFSDAMFSSLDNYRQADFWKDHASIYIAMDKKVYRYDIFAAFETNVKSTVYRLDLEENQEMFIEFCMKNTTINTGVIPEVGERILTLSTCTASNTNRRWVVQGVLREEFDRNYSRES